jgi:hypothetical protein
MAKTYGLAGVLEFILTRRLSFHRRRLSPDEAQLLEQYRALTENDQVAMRYLIGAMKSISRF